MTTPTDVSRAHNRAIFDLLAPLADPPTSYLRFFGKVDKTDADLTYPYLVAWPAPGYREAVNLTGTVYDLTTVTQITAVGNDVDEVLAVLDRAALLLQAVKPDLPGRLPGRVHEIPTNVPIRETESSRTPKGQPYYMGYCLYQLNSTAASTL